MINNFSGNISKGFNTMNEIAFERINSKERLLVYVPYENHENQ